MGLLDYEEPKKRYSKPKPTGKYRRESEESQEQRDAELNNFGRGEVTEDFGDSNFADRV